MSASGWEGILDEGEKILWQGRPDARVRLTGGLFQSVFGALFLGFALFWTAMAISLTGGNGTPGLFRYVFPMFGLPFIAIGAYMVFGRFFWDAYKRQNTWYTLSDRRAFVATDLPLVGRGLKSWRIEPDTRLELRPGPPASVFFAEETRQGNKGASYTVPIGFEWIEEGETVYRLIRDIQEEARR